MRGAIPPHSSTSLWRGNQLSTGTALQRVRWDKMDTEPADTSVSAETKC